MVLGMVTGGAHSGREHGCYVCRPKASKRVNLKGISECPGGFLGWARARGHGPPVGSVESESSYLASTKSMRNLFWCMRCAIIHAITQETRKKLNKKMETEVKIKILKKLAHTQNHSKVWTH